MLAELRIQSLGIIERLDWSLAPGFCVVTGETGAGKSLLIDAVATLLEGKLDEELIRHGADAARIEAVFFISSETAARINDTLSAKGLESYEDALALSCEFRRGGRAIFRLNGNAVPRSLVRDLGSLLLDMHGQSEHLSLFNERNHLDFLDAYAHTLAKREDFALKGGALSRLSDDIKAMDDAGRDRAHRSEILHYQIDEIKRAGLREGEDESLERERTVASSTEKLKALSYEAYMALDGEDAGEAALPRLGQAQEAIRRLSDIDASLKNALEQFEIAFTNLQDLARELHRYADGLEYDPARLMEIQERLELIRALKKKYGNSIEGINGYSEQAESELGSLDRQDEIKAGLQADRLKLMREMGAQAEELSALRQKSALRLQKDVKRELKELNLAQVEFSIRFKRAEAPDGLPGSNGRCYEYSRTGIDEVEFLVATNIGEPLKPLALIASTGEVSRITLALKVALAEADKTPVLVFDEIDIGIGGRSGEVIGRKLWALGRNHQVICVTHLPQIAVYGEAHYSVVKGTSGARTTTSVAAVSGKARLKELTLMLGGVQAGATTERDASEMESRASAWIKEQSQDQADF